MLNWYPSALFYIPVMTVLFFVRESLQIEILEINEINKIWKDTVLDCENPVWH